MMSVGELRCFLLRLSIIILVVSFKVGQAAPTLRFKKWPGEELARKWETFESGLGEGERLLRGRRGGSSIADSGSSSWLHGYREQSTVQTQDRWGGEICDSGVGSTICRIRIIRGTVYDVTKYGAIGNGWSDDKPAFLKAFAAACANNGPAIVLVPRANTFLVSDFVIKSCQSKELTWKVQGTILAPGDDAMWSKPVPEAWIQFLNVSNLAVVGEGTLNGNAENRWLNPSAPRPKGITFSGCDDLQVSGVTIKDMAAQQIELSDSDNTLIVGIRILSPFKAPNVVGVQTSIVSRVTIRGSYISTGDDNIAVLGGSSSVEIKDTYIAFGHGIRIGSVGADGGADGASGCVSDISVERCVFDKTQYGARIVTRQDDAGAIRNVRYENLRMFDVTVPIHISQFESDPVCIANGECELGVGNGGGGVAIHNVTYMHIRGTYSNVSSSEDTQALPAHIAMPRPAFIACSPYTPCHITLSNIWLRPSWDMLPYPITLCYYIYGTTDGTLQDCLINAPYPPLDLAQTLDAIAVACSLKEASEYAWFATPHVKCAVPKSAPTSPLCTDPKTNIVLSSRVIGPVNEEMDVYTYKFSIWVFNYAIDDATFYFPVPTSAQFPDKDVCKFSTEKTWRRSSSDSDGPYDTYGPFYHDSYDKAIDSRCNPCIDDLGMTIVNIAKLEPSLRSAALTISINLRMYSAPLLEGVLFDSTCGSGTFPEVDAQF